MGRGLSIVPASDSSHSPSAIPSRSLDYSFKLIIYLIPSGMKVYTGLSSGTSSSQPLSLSLDKSQVYILPHTWRHSCSGGFDWNATDDTHENYHRTEMGPCWPPCFRCRSRASICSSIRCTLYACGASC